MLSCQSCYLLVFNKKVSGNILTQFGRKHIIKAYSPFNIGIINLIRYRGYYYDNETGLYYLMTRYYDPATGRFISADHLAYLDPESLNGLNLYAYCLNNPIMGYDPEGTIAITLLCAIIGAIIGAAAGFGVAANNDYNDDGEIFNGSVPWYNYAGATVVGGATGGLIGYAAPAIASFLGTTFTASIPTITGSGGALAISSVSISVTGTQIAVGLAAVAGLTVLFARTTKRNGYYGEAWPGDPHKPKHIHLRGNGIDIRIGYDGKPLPGENPLPPQARRALEYLWEEFLKLFEILW